MKTALAGASALDDGIVCELYTITLSTGEHLYYTTLDVDVPYRGVTYLADKVAIDRTTITTKAGFEIDDLTVSLYPKDGYELHGMTLPIFTRNDGFKAAKVKIERARKSRVVHLYEGMVVHNVPNREKVDLVLNPPTVLLNVEMPKNVYCPNCIYTLFKKGCGLNKEDWAHSSSVLTGSTNRVLLCGLTQADDYFTLGSIVFTSGANAGLSRTVADYSVGHLTLSLALPHTPAIGDTFIAYPGCDRKQATCGTKFSNANFRGFPYMPEPEKSAWTT